jgi:NAD(P)-dependent dehydrogenase (short-subunit alcohol dehydrogenase family)
VDYGIVLSGEVVLVLDDAETVLRAGDVVARALVPLMPADGTASIVNIGSIAALRAHHALAYTVSKWGSAG